MKNQIALAAMDVPVGHRIRAMCPACGGGASKEQSLSIAKSPNGNTYYLCYRASCGLRGVIGGSPSQGITEAKKKPPKPFVGAFTELPKHVVEFLYKSYGIKAPKEWKWTGSRVLIPLLDSEGVRWGWCARKFPALYDIEGPKTLVYYDNTVLGYSY